MDSGEESDGESQTVDKQAEEVNEDEDRQDHRVGVTLDEDDIQAAFGDLEANEEDEEVQVAGRKRKIPEADQLAKRRRKQLEAYYSSSKCVR